MELDLCDGHLLIDQLATLYLLYFVVLTVPQVFEIKD